MIFDNRENECILLVLRILDNKPSRYSVLFKQTKVSHTTLQNVLKELLKNEFVLKGDIEYIITIKGKNLFRKLEELVKILR